MSFRLGQYGIRPENIISNIAHRLDHISLWPYKIEKVLDKINDSDIIIERPWPYVGWPKQHEKRFLEGSYEILVRRKPDTGLRPRPPGSQNVFGDDEKLFYYVEDGT